MSEMKDIEVVDRAVGREVKKKRKKINITKIIIKEI